MLKQSVEFAQLFLVIRKRRLVSAYTPYASGDPCGDFGFLGGTFMKQTEDVVEAFGSKQDPAD
ncbi:hypothetical protein D3C87_2127420 [compost metagenome]